MEIENTEESPKQKQKGRGAGMPAPGSLLRDIIEGKPMCWERKPELVSKGYRGGVEHQRGVTCIRY